MVLRNIPKIKTLRYKTTPEKTWRESFASSPGGTVRATTICSRRRRRDSFTRRFHTDAELRAGVNQWLNRQAADFYGEGNEWLVARYDKCLNLNVEKWPMGLPYKMY